MILVFLKQLFDKFCSLLSDRSYLRITQQEFYTLPLDIVAQGILSLIIALYGILYIAGDFKEIRATTELENRSWETLKNIPSFYSFNHRGKSLYRVDDEYE